MHVVLILFLKTLYFNILPGAVAGLYVCYQITKYVRLFLEEKAKDDIYLRMSPEAYGVGIAVAVGLPIVAMIGPVV